MIEALIMLGVGLLLGASFYMVYHLYPSKKDVKGDKE